MRWRGTARSMKNPFQRFGLLVSLILLFAAPLLLGAADGNGTDHHQHGVDGAKLRVWWVLPFVGMLLSIAVGPLVAPHFWHANYGKVAAGWIAVFSVPFLAMFGGKAVYEILHIVLLSVLFEMAPRLQKHGALGSTCPPNF